jgi:hypothetical protein
MADLIAELIALLGGLSGPGNTSQVIAKIIEVLSGA